jgi:hypothetical protein
MSMFDHSWAYHPNLVGRLMKKWWYTADLLDE